MQLTQLAPGKSGPMRFPLLSNRARCHALLTYNFRLGSGAVMAIEDALILERLLGKVHTHNDIVTAFETFDELRRPRTQQVIEMSSGTGTLFCGKDSRAGLDPRKLRDLMPQRWHWIWHMDVDQHVKEAEMAYERRKTT